MMPPAEWFKDIKRRVSEIRKVWGPKNWPRRLCFESYDKRYITELQYHSQRKSLRWLAKVTGRGQLMIENYGQAWAKEPEEAAKLAIAIAALDRMGA